MLKSVFVFFLAIYFLNGCSQSKPFDVTLIGFYNLENLFDTIDQPNVLDEEFTPTGVKHYNSKIYTDKLNKLSRVISDIGTGTSPDGIALLGVAEIENRSVLEDLVKTNSLKARDYHIAHIDGPDERGIDVALLYNPKYFKIREMQSLHVPTEKLDSIYGYTRDVLFISGDLLGEPIYVFVNHWPSRRGGVEASRPYRNLAAFVCKHKIDSLMAIDANTKVILMGDLNDDPVDESVTKILTAKGSLKAVNKGDLYNPWVSIFKNGSGTLEYNNNWNLFDQIMVSSAFLHTEQAGFFYKDAVIFKRDYMVVNNGKYKGYPRRTYIHNKYAWGYSDHFPTYIVLEKAAN